MRKSSRLVSVVFSHLALLCGLFALPTAGLSQGVTYPVLNWIPPTLAHGLSVRFLYLSGNYAAAPCPASITGAKEITGNIPMWLGGTLLHPVANPAMVGKDPTVKGDGSDTD